MEGRPFTTPPGTLLSFTHDTASKAKKEAGVHSALSQEPGDHPGFGGAGGRSAGRGRTAGRGNWSGRGSAGERRGSAGSLRGVRRGPVRPRISGRASVRVGLSVLDTS